MSKITERIAARNLRVQQIRVADQAIEDLRQHCADMMNHFQQQIGSRDIRLDAFIEMPRNPKKWYQFWL